MRAGTQFDLASPGGVSTTAILGQDTRGTSRCYIPCPGGIRLRCCSCRTWMFFCCETLVMALISTLAILYIAHFTDRLAAGGAEVAQQQQFLTSQRRTGGGVASNQLGAAFLIHNASSVVFVHNQTVHDMKAENNTTKPEMLMPAYEPDPLWKQQVEYISNHFYNYVARHEDVSARLESIRLGKLLAISAHVSTWSNVLHLRINFEVENLTTSMEMSTQSSNDLRQLRKTSPRRRPTTSAPRRRPQLLGPMEQAQGSPSNHSMAQNKNETSRGESRAFEKVDLQAKRILREKAKIDP